LGERNTSSPQNKFIDQDSNKNNILQHKKIREKGTQSTEREMVTKSITGADARRIGSNNPDPDPIEKLWNIVKTNVERCKPKNCRKLEWL